jgi:hypothetical protein
MVKDIESKCAPIFETYINQGLIAPRKVSMALDLPQKPQELEAR